MEPARMVKAVWITYNIVWTRNIIFIYLCRVRLNGICSLEGKTNQTLIRNSEAIPSISLPSASLLASRLSLRITLDGEYSFHLLV